MIGIVKFFDRIKGYGFIKTNFGDVFVSMQSIEKSDIFQIHKGQKIKFELKIQRGNLVAINLMSLDP